MFHPCLPCSTQKLNLEKGPTKSLVNHYQLLYCLTHSALMQLPLQHSYQPLTVLSQGQRRRLMQGKNMLWKVTFT
jgi:hypothetical protein